LPDFETRLKQRLDNRKRENRWRRHIELDAEQSSIVLVDGKHCINFCNNDYLGLASDERLKRALQEGADRYGVGSGASHLVCGHSAAHRKLESALAEFCRRDRALLFSTGYMANLAVVQALSERNDIVIEDRLNHASLIDAANIARAKMLRYQHADTRSLGQQLERVNSQNAIVVSDGVFSMDGDIAPLCEMSKLCRENDACLFVDDAHGFGVLGEQGAGVVERLSLSQNDVPVLVGTLGKAFGTAGAFVAGSETVIENLIQFARTYIYTTAMSPALACASLESLNIVREETWRRQNLNEHIRVFRQRCAGNGLTLMPSETAIQPLMVGTETLALAFSEKLMERGFWVTAIRPPTVPENQSRLRITLNATHSEVQVLQLADALAEIKGELDWNGVPCA